MFLSHLCPRVDYAPLPNLLPFHHFENCLAILVCSLLMVLIKWRLVLDYFIELTLFSCDTAIIKLILRKYIWKKTTSWSHKLDIKSTESRVFN